MHAWDRVFKEMIRDACWRTFPRPYQSKDGKSVWLSGLVQIQRHRIISMKGASIDDGKSQWYV